MTDFDYEIHPPFDLEEADKTYSNEEWRLERRMISDTSEIVTREEVERLVRGLFND